MASPTGQPLSVSAAETDNGCPVDALTPRPGSTGECPGLDQARDGRHDQDADDHDQRHRGGHLGHGHGLAAVDERQGVLVQRMQDQLHTDERQNDRQAQRQVHQPLQQATDEEVQLTQAHQGERVGGEHDVRLLGETVDRGNRVECKQQIGEADHNQCQQQRSDDALAVDLGGEAVAVVLLGRRQVLLDQRDDLRVAFLLVFLARGPGPSPACRPCRRGRSRTGRRPS